MFKIKVSRIGVLIMCIVLILGVFITLLSNGNRNNASQQKLINVKSCLSITNFDYMGNPRNIFFSDVPHHVIVARPEILDALIAIHAEDAVCAAYITRNQEERIPILKKKMPWCKFYTNELDRETALLLEPDFIVGWRMNFRKGALGNIDFWTERNIPVYIEENSGPVPAVDPFPPSSVDSEIQFLKNMGTIFHKEKETQLLVNEIQSTLDTAKKEAKKNGSRKILTIEFMGNKIEVFGDKLLSGDIIKQLGCSNYNYETPFISREQLRLSDADTIFVIYHGSEIEAQNAVKRLSAPEFRDIPAVRNKRIYLLPYRFVCASNIYTSHCIKEIYKGIYG